MGNDEAPQSACGAKDAGETKPEDLSGNLIVQLGTMTEDLNRTWYERNTGRTVGDVQRLVKHSAIPWMAATLDGVIGEREPCSKPSSCCLVVLRGGSRGAMISSFKTSARANE
jgi:hypothetical protein